MKFRKQIPTKPGLYWYVDKDYPDPQICYLMFNHMYTINGGETILKQDHYEHYRWGDEIEKPPCKENKVEG